MKKILTKFKGLMLLFAVLGFANTSQAQTPTYQLYFTNVTTTANTITWDAYLLRTGATELQLATIQFGFGFDVTILNGGTPTGSIISGFSDLPTPMQPTSVVVSGSFTNGPIPVGTTYRYVSVAAKAPPGAGNGPLISNTDGGCGSKGTRIGRFRLTNSVNFTANSKMNHIFNSTGGAQRTITQVNAYVGTTNTNVTVIANHFSFNVASTCDPNPTLNPVATCAVTGSATTTAVTCFGNTDGSAEVTLTGTGSGAPGTYTVDGSAPQPFNTNPFTISGLSAGSHTVVATVTAGGCVSESIVFNVGDVAAITGSQTGGTAVSCNGDSDGTAEITLTGGSGGGTYSLDGGASVPYAANPFTISGLSGGAHTVTATTAAGCVSNLISVSVSSPAIFAGSATSTDATCEGGGNNGTATVTLTGGNSQAPGTYSLDGGAAVPYATNPFVITGLTPGSHSIVVTAGPCTTAPIAVFIGAPATFSATYVKTNISACNATNDGTITITPTGGTAPYTYVWSGGYPGFAPGNVAAVSNLPIGYYNVTVTDAGGCGVVVLSNIHIQFAFTTIVTNSGSTTSACGNNGSIILYGNAGVQPYTYSIDGTNYQSSNLFTGLAAGTYTGYIKDAAGCVGTKPNIVIAAAAPIVVNPFVRNASSCGNDGSIEIYRTGGIPPYSYSLDDVTYQTSNVFSGLAAGSYTAYVKDSKGCVGSQSATVGQGAALTLSTLVTNTSTCTFDGTIRVTVSGGIAPFTYSLDGISYQSSNLFAGLASGPYTVYAKDSKGCTGQTNVTINLNTINVTAYAVAASSCATNNGSITLFRTGGVGPYTYSLDGNTYQSSSLFSGLAAGTYTGYVKDSKGCIGQLEGIVVGPTNCAPPVANNAKGIVTATVEPLVSSLKVQAYPNPSTDEFTLVLSGYNMNEKVSVVISDVMGRKVYQAEGTGKQQYRFGKSFFAGLYTVQVIQGTDKKSLKLVKE